MAKMTKAEKLVHQETRRVDINLAKTFVHKRNVTVEELDFVIAMLESDQRPGYKKIGLLTVLRNRRASLG